MKQKIFTLAILLIAFSLQSQVVRKVVVEHFTNSRCPVCAGSNPVLYNLLEDYPEVLHIAYHPSSPYSTCIFSQYNPTENDARTNYYDVYGSTPRVVLQGQVIGFQNPILTSEQLDAETGMYSDYELNVTQEVISSGIAEVTITVKKVSERSEIALSLYSGIVEKIINYNAPNGETYHPDVFRKVLVDDNLNSIALGDSVVITKNYSFDQVWDKDQMYVYALLQNTDTKGIIQAEASGTIGEGPSVIGENKISTLSNVYYPNPAGNTIHLQPSYVGEFSHVEIYDLNGSLVQSSDDPSNLKIFDLPQGIYFIQLTDNENRRFSTKIIKSN